MPCPYTDQYEGRRVCLQRSVVELAEERGGAQGDPGRYYGVARQNLENYYFCRKISLNMPVVNFVSIYFSHLILLHGLGDESSARAKLGHLEIKTQFQCFPRPIQGQVFCTCRKVAQLAK